MRRKWLAGLPAALALLLAGAMLLACPAMALTPAGTEIRNQSVAEYEDSGGNPYSTSSNEVINIVDALYSFEITPNATGGGAGAPGTFGGTAALTQYAAPGATVYYSYKLTNTGNQKDSYQFSRANGAADDIDAVAGSVVIYSDANGNGVVDPGDTILTTGATGMGIASWGASQLGPVNADDYVNIIIAYQVPVTATGGQEIDMDLDGRSAGDNTVTDGVSNFNTTTVATAQGILTLAKSVDKTDADEGDTLTYTFTGSNTGNAKVQSRVYAGVLDLNGDAALDANASGVLLTDIFHSYLDPGLDNASNISGVSSAPSGSTVLYTADGTNWYRDADDIPGAGVPITGIALFIPDATPGDAVVEDVLAVGQGFSLTFSIPLDGTLNNVTVPNTGTIYYNDGGADRERISNEVNTDVGGNPASPNGDVEIGAMNDPDSSLATAGGDAIGAAAHPKVDDPLTDQVETLIRYGANDGIAEGREDTVGDRHAGQTTYFINTVRNDSGDVDTMDITFAHALPAGYVVELMKSDGITPLVDTDGDGVPDTGPMAVGATYNVVVKVKIPGNAAAGANLDITLTATSTIDPAETDTTVDRIVTVIPVAVDIGAFDTVTGTRTGDNDGEANDNPAGQSTDPGSYVDFAVDVENIYADGTETGARDTYDLAVSGLPAGWSAVVYLDADGNGTLEEGELNPIEDSGDLNPWNGTPASGEGESVTTIIRVFVPAGENAGLNNITYTATSTQNGTVSDSVTLAVTVNTVRAIKIQPDNSRVSVRGGVVTYTHQVTNIGNTTERWALTLNSSESWGVVFVTASGANIGGTAVIGAADDYQATIDATTNDLDPGESVEIYVKVFVPANAPVATVDNVTVTVADADNGGLVTDSAIDTTTVIEGNLQLDKVSDPTDDPGNVLKPTLTTQAPQAAGNDYHPLEYTTTYTNLGADTAVNVVITDAVPDYTRIIVDDTGGGLAAEPVPDGSVAGRLFYSTDGGITFTDWNAADPAGGADASGARSDITHIRWVIGNVPSGDSGTVTFTVLVD